MAFLARAGLRGPLDTIFAMPIVQREFPTGFRGVTSQLFEKEIHACLAAFWAA